MRKRTILAILIAFTLTLGLTAMWTAQTTERDGDTDANIVSDTGAETGKSEKKGGNKIARIFKAPFKAVGKLFGRGNNDNKLERLTEKDVERFESAGTMRVSDGTTLVQSKPSASGSARDHLRAGRALLQTGQLNEAITELSRAVALDPHLSEAHSLMGLAYDRRGMPERAKDSYERAMKETPDDAQTLNNLGYSLYLNGNYRAAMDRLKRAARLAPADQRILNNLALAQCRLGKHEDAFKNFARAGGELNGRLNTAAMLERQGYETEAITYYEAARRLQPGSGVALRRLADLYKRVGRYEDAQAASHALESTAGETASIGGK
ncbi:MAG TPA: tetratricopeptide repeat protein [Pyrinomonadaceae bacterium]|jgi:Tfp pilus assembly protein PilF